MTYGIDIGTTTVAAVAVVADGTLVTSVSVPHHADVPGLGVGVDEQDPAKLLAAAQEALAKVGADPAARIGWTGQMHGVVGVDRALQPVTRFVTWRDARRFGGTVMEGWARTGCTDIFKCLTSSGFIQAALTGRCAIDATFLHAWHVEGRDFPREWIPDLVPDSMLGDNQAGVFAARRLVPGAAVVNIGTSGQLSVVGEGPGGERRPYFDTVLRCRASHVGGQRLAALRARLGISWEELNARAEEPEIAVCLDAIAEDLAGNLALSSATPLVGVGNALQRNPALRRAVERRFDRPCIIPAIPEMAAYGAALTQLEET